MHPATLAVHAGAEPDAETGAVAPPIHLATTFRHGPAGERVAGYEYQREGNPTQDRLEAALAALEGGAAALAFASGMAAISGPARSAARRRARADPGRLLQRPALPRTRIPAERGIDAVAVDMADLDAVEAACARPRRADLGRNAVQPAHEDLRHRRAGAHRARARRAAGLRQHLRHAGAAAAAGARRRRRDALDHQVLRRPQRRARRRAGVRARATSSSTRVAHRRHITGAMLAPFSAWLTLRGCRSLPARMALALRAMRAGSPTSWRRIRRSNAVNYPGLAIAPGPRDRRAADVAISARC